MPKSEENQTEEQDTSETYLIITDPKTKEIIPFNDLGDITQSMSVIIDSTLLEASNLTWKDCKTFQDLDRTVVANLIEKKLFTSNVISQYRGIINFSLYYPLDNSYAFIVYIDSKYNHIDDAVHYVDESSLVFKDLHHVTVIS